MYDHVFDYLYSVLRSETFILSKLFRILLEAVSKTYTYWFIENEKGMLYLIMTVKIDKDTMELGHQLRCSIHKHSNSGL